MLRLTTVYKGKFRHTFVHDNDFDLDEIKKIKVPPGPYFSNRLRLATQKGIISPFFMGSYQEFLLTKEWKEMRDTVIELWGGKCIMLGCNHKAVEVHHKTYQFGWLPIFEGCKPEPLIPLCKKHHLFMHL